MNLNNILKTKHPGWRFYLWTDDEMYHFIRQQYPHYLNVYTNFPSNIQRCDFFRYLVVYHYGGFYFDLDTLIFKNINFLTNQELCLFNEKTLTLDECIVHNHNIAEKARVANYAFGSIPNHDFLLNVIKHININKTNIQCTNDVLETTGPGMLTTLYHKYKPCNLIYPSIKINNQYLCSCKNFRCCRIGDYGSHLHMGTWRNLSDNVNMRYIISNAIEHLKLEIASPKYKQDIIEYINDKYPFINTEKIHNSLREYWLT